LPRTRFPLPSKSDRRSVWLLAAVFTLAVCTFAGSALAPDGSGSARPFAVSQLAPKKSTPNPLAGRLKKVYGTNTPASRYGAENAALEDEGTNLAGEQISELSPLPPSTFTAPENEYRAYGRRWIGNALAGAASLGHALAAGDRTAAMTAWESTWSDYLHLGAVYLTGPAATLNRAIDGTPGGFPGGSSDPRFTGLHRIELGLWSGARPQTLIAYDRRLERDLKRMREDVV
jgi:iron uptake system EfeUOB component EfeO/EfeM